jgi:hypothetical protein
MQVTSEKTILLDSGEILKEIEERGLESLVASVELSDDD